MRSVSMPWADRLAWDLTPNRLAQRQQALRQAGVSLLDLTESNPTRCGFRYPTAWVTELADPRALTYEPSPRGWRPAREAVAARYAAHGVPVGPDELVLTASTSEAYSFLCRVWCNPGDQVLVPQPSYPLFDYLLRLNDVQPAAYPLRYEGRWRVDAEAVERAVTERTRALIVVHPNNPTGSCVTHDEWAHVVRVCQRHELPLIADEVFADYRSAAASNGPQSMLGHPDILTCGLGGLSKALGLPQMKVAWLAVSGPPARRRELLERLEVVADTYLSVNTPAQLALPQWLQRAPEIQAQIRQRVADNRQWLTAQCAAHLGVECLAADGGWSAVLRVPSLRDEESFVVRLVDQEHLLIHPGYFFDFEEPGHLVVSLLPSPELFREGIARLLHAVLKSGF